MIYFVADRPGHDRRYAINSFLIEKKLGWKKKENFESGLKKTVFWYLENQNWWKNILIKKYSLKRLGILKKKGN